MAIARRPPACSTASAIASSSSATQSHSSPSTSSARWPIPNRGSTPMPSRPGSSTRSTDPRPGSNSAGGVQRWPSRPTYWRSSRQIGDAAGGAPEGGYCVQHVTQMYVSGTAVAWHAVTRRAPTFPLYVGGFLGPVRGAVPAVLIPQLRDAFDASTATIAAAIPAYLVPFAVLQLVSGTIGERLGRRRVVRSGYVAYAVACLAAALAPDVGLFLGARAVAGAANAFLSPLLLAGLADVTEVGLGRAVGTFAAVQTSAVALSPLCGGLLGALGWRCAFLVPAAMAVALALVPPPDADPRAPGVGPP